MTEKLEPDEIYIQLGENRTGLGICLRRWQDTPFEGGIKYTRAQPKYKRVDFDGERPACEPDNDKYGPMHHKGWNDCIDHLAAKYGDLYTIESE